MLHVWVTRSVTVRSQDEQHKVTVIWREKLDTSDRSALRHPPPPTTAICRLWQKATWQYSHYAQIWCLHQLSNLNSQVADTITKPQAQILTEPNVPAPSFLPPLLPSGSSLKRSVKRSSSEYRKCGNTVSRRRESLLQEPRFIEVTSKLVQGPHDSHVTLRAGLSCQGPHDSHVTLGAGLSCHDTHTFMVRHIKIHHKIRHKFPC
jgi:hypothetical protein